MTTCNKASKDYSPEGGNIGSTPVLVTADHIVLTYPYTSPTTTISLPNPQLGNTETYKHQRVANRTRNGKLILFDKSYWPKFTSLKYSFRALTESNKTDITNFVALSLANEIGILDYESRQWRGFIISPNAPVSDVGRIGCNYTWDIEFQGVLV